MGSYKIEIEVTDAGGVYTADNLEEANGIATSECYEIYARLKGRCSVNILSVTEIKS